MALWGVALLTLLAVVTGFATSLTAGSAGVGAGNAAAARCDTSGVTTVYTLTTTNVTGVTVSNIDAACAGKSIKVTLDNKLTTSSGSGTVPAGGGSMSITVTAIAVTQIMQDEISVV